MIMLQPAEWTAENVRDFPVKETLVRFLSSMYEIQTQLMDSVNYGLPVARLRLYMNGRHLGKTCSPTRTLVNHCETLLRPCSFGWEEVFWMNDAALASTTAIENEVSAEWTWGINRPSSVYQQNKRQLEADATCSESKGASTSIPLRDSDDANVNNVASYDFEVALSLQESHNARLYELRWPSMVFSLNQNADERGYKSTNKYLQTFLHNFGLLWTFSQKAVRKPRWLFASEALSAMGFPVHPDFWHGINHAQAPYVLCSFNVGRPLRKPTDVRAQCGNSDSLPLAAVAEMYSILYIQTLTFVFNHIHFLFCLFGF